LYNCHKLYCLMTKQILNLNLYTKYKVYYYETIRGILEFTFHKSHVKSFHVISCAVGQWPLCLHPKSTDFREGVKKRRC